MRRWFIKNGDYVSGPFEPSEIRSMAFAGAISKTAWISSSQSGEWKPVTQVQGLKFAKENSHDETIERTCPFCAEKIKNAAIKCKHCGEFLSKSLPSSPDVKDSRSRNEREIEKVQCAKCGNQILSLTANANSGLCMPCSGRRLTGNQKITRRRDTYGRINAAMKCPHCGTKGKNRTKEISPKKGVSGGKATAAILTGGISLLAVGLSRRETKTQAHCEDCYNTWEI